MSLLPKSSKDFSSVAYWEAFFKNRGDKVFEWYGEFSTLKELLAKYVKLSDKVLIAGCGNSELGLHMYDNDYKSITCIDIIPEVIERMKKYCDDKPGIVYQCMDIFQTQYQEGEFNVVLDKGTLDAIYSEDNEEQNIQIDKMFAEIARIIKIGGRYLCITLAQTFIAKKLIHYFVNEGWMIRVCLNASSTRKNQSDLPVFMFVLTKFKKMPNAKPILELSLFDDKAERVESTEEILSAISNLQNYALVKNNLHYGKSLEHQVCVELHDQSSSAPKYTIHVVDGKGKKNKKFAVFIVPLGRECEWLFSTEDGRKQLHESCGFSRLLVVLLNRNHKYSNIEAIKEELSSKVPQLASHLIDVDNSPFLSLGDSVNVTLSRHEGTSGLSGSYVVEDVRVNEDIHRRLIFNSSPNVIQTEAVLINKVKKGGKKNIVKLKVDHNTLVCQYYVPVVGGLVFAENFSKNTSETKVALIGLGGGCLAMYMHENFNKVKLKVVELDPDIVTVAQKHFDLKQDERLQVEVGDGLDFIKDASVKGDKYDMLIVDVDNKESSEGISCPPASFLDIPILKSCSDIIVKEGVFVLNLATRSKEKRDLVVSKLKNVFDEIYSIQVEEDVNEILYCLRRHLLDDEHKTADFVEVLGKTFDLVKTKINSKAPGGLLRFKPGRIKCL